MISYQRKGKDVCKKIYEQLSQNGFRVWFDINPPPQIKKACPYKVSRNIVKFWVPFY